MTRKSLAAGALALAALVGVSSGQASAQTPVAVADYQDDFAVGALPPGWSLLWNANGPLGTPANYQPLVVDNGRYETVANGTYPDASPGASLALGRSAPDPLLYDQVPILPPLPTTFVRPGQGLVPGPIEHAAIIAYTFSAADFAEAGIPAGQRAQGFLGNYYFAVSKASADGISARVYQGNDPTPIINFSTDAVPPFPFPPGFTYEASIDPRGLTHFPAGTYAVGDTMYIAIGSNATDVGDELRLDFTLGLSPVPEPTAMMALAPLAGALLMRRRRR
jgi:hypothetical protein